MKNINLNDLGFIRDDVQPNHWNNGEFLLYENMTGEFVFSNFTEDGGINILNTEDNLYYMKNYLIDYFKFEFREKRLSKILDKDSPEGVLPTSGN